MQTDKDLLEAAHQATSVASVLAKCPRSTRQTRRLTIADHADTVDALRGALTAMTGAPGVLRSTLRVIMELRDFPAEPPHQADSRLVPALADLYQTVDHARIQASRAELEPAGQWLRADLRRLAATGSPAAGATPARNLLAVRAAEATEHIMCLGGRIHPDTGSMEDLVTAVATAAEVLAGLRAACLHEAKRIELAYRGVALGRSGAIISEILTAAAHALAAANSTLTAAGEAARAISEPHHILLAAA